MPPKFKDLTGNIIGKLTVINLANYKKDRCNYWNCLCECGTITTVKATSLITNKTKSCGCLKKTHFIDLTGKKFNKLTILLYDRKNTSNCHVYKAQCDCGKIISIEGNDVSSGRSKSCGCMRYAKSVANAKPVESLIHNIFNQYRGRKRHGLKFELTKEQVLKLIFDKCYYCNSEVSNTAYSRNRQYSVNYNGIDRIDNNLGYVLENCVTACYKCNQAKHMLSLKSFKDWIIKLTKAIENKTGIWDNK